MTVAIFLAGLWPFDFDPENRAWLLKGGGISFNERGHAYTHVPEDGAGLFENGEVTVEILLEPEKEPSSHIADILTFRDTWNRELFAVSQWRSEVILRSSCVGKAYREAGFDKALQKGKPVFITISSDENGTAIYKDGKKEGFYPGIKAACDKNTGAAFSLGNSPTGVNQWRGVIFAIAAYKKSLGQEEVKLHFLSARERGAFILRNYSPSILYLFGEGRGDIAHNSAGHGHDLHIPKTFRVLKKNVLISPGDDLRFNKGYILDIVFNIAGFVPFGFFCTALLFKIFKSRARGYVIYLAVIITGFLSSLAIELIQAYLPSRTSSLTDLSTNTLGTAAGVLIYIILRQHSREP